MKPSARLKGVAGILLLLWAAVTGASVAWRLFFMWISVVILLDLLLRYWAANLSCSVMLRAIGESHDGNFEITYVFANNGLLPIPGCWVSVHLEKELGSFALVPEAMAFSISEIKAVRKSFHCPKRGIYAVGGATAVLPDLLGLRTKAVTYEKKMRVEVFPRKYPVVSLLSSGWEEGGALRSSGTAEQDYSSISSLRQALPQEPARHIHWKASARTEELQVREYETRRRPGVIVLLDNTGEKYSADPEGKIEERCVEVAAGLVSHWVGRGYAVELMTGSGYGLRIDGAESLESAMRVLMVFAPQLQGSLTYALSNLWKERRQGVLLHVVTPMLSAQETAACSGVSAHSVSIFQVGTAEEAVAGSLRFTRIPV